MNQKPVAPADASGPEESLLPDETPKYRSVADGELLTTWSLDDFFSSLNPVMRFPARMRRKQAEAPAGVSGLPWLDTIRVPKGLIGVAVILILGVFVVRPLVLSASGGGDASNFSQAYGVWQAKTGKYAGRMLEVGEHSIAFRTSSDSPDYSWHRIESVTFAGTQDSTLFTVVYDEEGKTAEFAFWLVQHDVPIIRFLHQPDTIWDKTPYEPIARPKV